MRFGEKLKELRIKANLTQEELAKKMDISSKTIGRWENQDTAPDITKLKKICKILKCNMSDLTSEKEIAIKESKKEMIRKEEVILPKQNKIKDVSLNMEDARYVKGLSKAINIIARIIKVLLCIGIAGLLILMICIPMLFKYVDITDHMVRFRVGDDALIIKEDENGVTLSYNDEQLASGMLTKEFYNKPLINIFNTTNENSIVWHLEILALLGIASIVLTYMVFNYLAKITKNIIDDKTPFKELNITYLQRMAYLLIGTIILSNVAEIVLVHLVNVEFNVQISLYEVITILALFLISLIFKYGMNLQKEVEGSIYGE